VMGYVQCERANVFGISLFESRSTVQTHSRQNSSHPRDFWKAVVWRVLFDDNGKSRMPDGATAMYVQAR
jgi:hypothetical protein